ncbi:MAG: hypothetical protein FWD97_01575 [Defluviitaleaceae bacterium]|nr:hypothetical protein [Defluviitaleaceae bacterium]
MNKEKFDQDEMLISNALEGVDTPQFNILKGIEEKMKPKRKMKRTAILAIAATLALGTTAFAAQQMGAFDRLRGIVGYEHAQDLTPIEIVAGRDEVMYDGVRVELVAINISDDAGQTVDVYFTLEDTRANRLNGDFRVYSSVRPTNLEISRELFSYGFSLPELIDRYESGVVTMRSQHNFNTPVSGLEFTFFLDEIIFDNVEEQFVPIPLNLADFLGETDTITYQYPNPNPWGTALQFGNLDDFSLWQGLHDYHMELIQGDGLSLLALGNLNRQLSPYFDFADTRASISSIGLIDGRLHVQIAHPERRILDEAGWEGFTHVSLFRGSLDYLNTLRAERQASLDAGYMPWEINSESLWDGTVASDVWVSFFADADGNTFMLNTMGVDAQGVAYTPYDPRAAGSLGMDEHIFDIDLDNIDQYVLMARTFSYQTLPVGWTVTFNAE